MPMPLLFETSQVTSHILWCVFGALFVAQWGEKMGITIFLGVAATLKLIQIIFFIFSFRNMTIL